MEEIAEQIIHPTLGFLHIISAVIWVGGMIYHQFGVGPALHKLGDAKAHALGGLASKNYSTLTWASFVILLGTGVYAIFDKWDEITASRGAAILLAIKLTIVLAFVVIFLIQMNYFGPRMARLINPATPKEQSVMLEMKRLGNTMKGLSWSHLGTGVAIIALGVVLSGTLDRIATEKTVHEEAWEMAPLLAPERRKSEEKSEEKGSDKEKDAKEKKDAGGEKESGEKSSEKKETEGGNSKPESR